MTPDHKRQGENESYEHERRCREEVVKDVMRQIVSKLTLRFVFGMLGSALVIGTFMVIIARSQNTTHENREHKELIERPEMNVEHGVLKNELSGEIDDLSDEVQDLSEKLDGYHEDQNKQYIKILEELRKLDATH